MRSRCSSKLLLALLLGVRVACAAEGDVPGSIAVVVGSSSALSGVTVDALREVYLRRQLIWPSGERALPVNLPADHPIRTVFSRRVLGRAPSELEGYWRRIYFEGIRPPLVLKTPLAVCAYVAVEPAAVGYVPLADVDRSQCRVLLVLDYQSAGR